LKSQKSLLLIMGQLLNHMGAGFLTPQRQFNPANWMAFLSTQKTITNLGLLLPIIFAKMVTDHSNILMVAQHF